MPSSKGKIHDVFFDTVSRLAEQAAAIGAGAGREWQVPEGVDPLDIAGTTAAFDRSAVDENYAEVIADASDPGTAGDVVSLKAQGDWVAVMERGFRARHCTPVRCWAMAMGRRRGHGHPRGVLLGGVVRYVTDALAAGQG